MCDDDVHGSAGHSVPPAFSRRRMLQGTAAVAALLAAGVGRGARAAAAPLVPRAPGLDGNPAYALAMHLHASTSEGIGSMSAQLAQAAQSGFDVAWFTEHDWRRLRLLFRPQYHFVAGDTSFGGTWGLPKLANVGSLATGSGGALVTTPVSPNDLWTGKKGSLRLRATSKTTNPATVRFHIDASGASRQNYASRITGRTISVDVLPTTSSSTGWGQVLFMLSRQVASTTRPAGQISVLYRHRPDVTARAYSTQGAQGIVDVPVVVDQWQTVSADLTSDVAALWPDLQAEDNSLNDIQFSATSSRKTPVEVFFSYLRFDEQVGYDALGVESALLQAYQAGVPSVQGMVGTEISLGPHVNQYGGVQNPYAYGPVSSLKLKLGELRPSIVQTIHTNGGLASLNHPFVPSDLSVAATPQAIARDLLAIGAGGADILEVGYAARGTNGTLANHLAVWDTLSRNAVFLTGNGASDDHTGTGWTTQKNRFYTGAFATGLSEAELLAALGSGRCFGAYLGSFSGTLDMTIDSTPMGSVLVDPSTDPRTLQIGVTGLPAGGAVQVVRGVVDYAGTATPMPNTSVVTSLGAAALALSTTVPADPGDPCFYRLQVVDASGAVVAFGQPVWLLHDVPTTGIPAARLPAPPPPPPVSGP